MPMLISKRLPVLRTTCWIVPLLAALIVGSVQGQVVPSATKQRHLLSVGGEYANVHASYPYGSIQRLWEIGGFADYGLVRTISIEGDIRHLPTNGFYGETQDNYLAGPKFTIRKLGRLQPYAQFIFGLGRLKDPSITGTANFFVLAPGAGASYRLSGRWAARGGYEYQMWQNSANLAGQHATNITPNGVHVGLAFTIF
jgi:opacity protein-like surface antigen